MNIMFIIYFLIYIFEGIMTMIATSSVVLFIIGAFVLYKVCKKIQLYNKKKNFDKNLCAHFTVDEWNKELNKNQIRANRFLKDSYVCITGKVFLFMDKNRFLISNLDENKNSLSTNYALNCSIIDKKLIDKIMELNIGDKIKVYGKFLDSMSLEVFDIERN